MLCATQGSCCLLYLAVVPPHNRIRLAGAGRKKQDIFWFCMRYQGLITKTADQPKPSQALQTKSQAGLQNALCHTRFMLLAISCCSTAPQQDSFGGSGSQKTRHTLVLHALPRAHHKNCWSAQTIASSPNKSQAGLQNALCHTRFMLLAISCCSTAPQQDSFGGSGSQKTRHTLVLHALPRAHHKNCWSAQTIASSPDKKPSRFAKCSVPHKVHAACYILL